MWSSGILPLSARKSWFIRSPFNTVRPVEGLFQAGKANWICCIWFFHHPVLSSTSRMEKPFIKIFNWKPKLIRFAPQTGFKLQIIQRILAWWPPWPYQEKIQTLIQKDSLFIERFYQRSCFSKLKSVLINLFQIKIFNEVHPSWCRLSNS